MQKDDTTLVTSTTLASDSKLAETATGHGRTMAETATGHGREVAETATGHGRTMAETATGHGYVAEESYAYDMNNNPDVAVVVDPTGGSVVNIV